MYVTAKVTCYIVAYVVGSITIGAMWCMYVGYTGSSIYLPSTQSIFPFKDVWSACLAQFYNTWYRSIISVYIFLFFIFFFYEENEGLYFFPEAKVEGKGTERNCTE